MNENVVSTLHCTKELLSDPDRWGKGYFFLSATGEQVDSKDAVRFCVLGAVRRCLGDDGILTGTYQTYKELRYALTETAPDRFDGAAQYNDAPETRHEDIMVWLDAAIERAEHA